MNCIGKIILVRCKTCGKITFPWQRQKNNFVCSHCGSEWVQLFSCFEIPKNDLVSFSHNPIHSTENYNYFLSLVYTFVKYNNEDETWYYN